MRKNFGVKPAVYPMPVFIIGTYNEDGSPNAMNAAWGGISEENQISICLDPEHKTLRTSFLGKHSPSAWLLWIRLLHVIMWE